MAEYIKTDEFARRKKGMQNKGQLDTPAGLLSIANDRFAEIDANKWK